MVHEKPRASPMTGPSSEGAPADFRDGPLLSSNRESSTVQVTRHRVKMPTGNQHQISHDEFERLREFIHRHTGISLSDHKRALVCSRLAKRLRHHGLRTYTDYYFLLLQNDPEGVELMEMINAITTNKTDFFREAHHFRFLSEKFFPAFKRVAHYGGARRMRLWSAGASTGEEPYSLAMTVLEAFPDIHDWDIKILATDIDTNVLARAEGGIYSHEQSQQIPPALLHRYFLKGMQDREETVMVKPALKELIRFRRLNLMDSDWPMHGLFDVILCRNVIIYFDKQTQSRVVSRLGRALQPNGYLMLGHTESLYGLELGLQPIGLSMYQHTKKPLAALAVI